MVLTYEPFTNLHTMVKLTWLVELIMEVRGQDSEVL